MNNYGLLGAALPHSYSPQIHSMLGSYPYVLTELDEAGAREFLQRHSFAGYNVTIPYKKLAYECCDILSPEARQIGSVNTLVVDKEGRLCGFNTDAFGFEYLISKLKVDPKGKKCIVLGSGGSSVMVTYVLKKLGAGSVHVISRTGEDNYSNIERHHDANIIVNTTPVGMYPKNGNSPIRLEDFNKCEALIDIIYNPHRTKLLLNAKKLGIPNIGGLAMLVAQAKAANELFFGIKRDDSLIDDITGRLEADMMNILLVGMPGCGKTTIGTWLSQTTGRELLDTDDLIQKREGKSPALIISESGEAAFRKIEHEILEEISKQSGKIIATGGGIVTNSENFDLMRQNSKIFYIDRELCELDTSNRPLSKVGKLSQMYEKRAPLYEAVSDFKIKFESSKQCADKILSILGLK